MRKGASKPYPAAHTHIALPIANIIIWEYTPPSLPHKHPKPDKQVRATLTKWHSRRLQTRERIRLMMLTFLAENRFETHDFGVTLCRRKSPGGGYSKKIGWGCADRFPKPLPYLWPKSAIFPTLFMTWLLNQNPVSDHHYNKFPSSEKGA